MSTEEQVDLNHAGVEDLTALPGIGQNLAERIVRYRRFTRPFDDITDVAEVSGISAGKLRSFEGKAQVTPLLGDRYETEKIIARGSRSTIYSGYDTVDDRQIAIKLLEGTFEADSDLVQDYRWAMTAASELDHPNIVKQEAIEVMPDGRFFVVMELVDGRPLPEYIAQHDDVDGVTMPVETLAIFRELAGALRAAHNKGVVHKNLAADKILIGEDDTPYLLGVDAPAVPGQRTQTAPNGGGFERYRSPEQRRGQALDGRSNIYSLGVIFYAMLAGSQFGPERQRPSVPLIPLEKVRKDLVEETYYLVQTCLQEDPWSRFQTMRELRVAIDEALQAEVSAAGDSAAELVAGGILISEHETDELVAVPPTSAGGRYGSWLPYAIAVPFLLLVVFLFIRFALNSDPPGDGGIQGFSPGGTATLAAGTGLETEQFTPTRSFIARTLTARALLAPGLQQAGQTPTLIPTPTDTATPTPTDTPTPTPTDTATPTPTDTPTPTPTNTPTPLPPTPTFTPLPPTFTPTPTEPPTSESKPPPPPPTPPPPG
jgi:serine/threonine-protein kinase